MFLLLDKDGVIVGIYTEAKREGTYIKTVDEKGTVVNFLNADDLSVEEIDSVPVSVEPSKSTYSKKSGFGRNPNFKQQLPPKEELDAVKNNVSAGVQNGILTKEQADYILNIENAY